MATGQTTKLTDLITTDKIAYKASPEFVDTIHTSNAKIVTNTHLVACLALTCVPKPSGCTGTYSTAGNVKITTLGQISVRQNNAAGYDETLCISCSNAAGSTHNIDGFKVHQDRDCETALDAAAATTAHPNAVLDYDATADSTGVAAVGVTKFFKNEFDTDCGATSTWTCSLLADGCASDYIPANLAMGTSPWATGFLTGKTTIEAGYEETVCI